MKRQHALKLSRTLPALGAAAVLALTVPTTAQSQTRTAKPRGDAPKVSAPAPRSAPPTTRSGGASSTRRLPVGRGSSSVRGRHHGGHHHGSRSSFYLGIGHWGFYPHYYPYYWPYWGPYYGPYYGPYWGRAPYRYGRYGYDDDLGALDLNVKPKKTQVFVDGQYAGLAKQFDGYPGYLVLEEGSHQVTFYLPGYQTESRVFQVRPGLVFDVRMRLREGESTPPDQVARLPMPEERGEKAPLSSRRAAPPPANGEDAPSTRDLRREPSRLRLTVEPEDASVYLDGRLLGSGRELAGLHAGLLVEPGEHQLEVVRPGYESRKLEVFAEPGEELDLTVRLTVAAAAAAATST